jgi:thermopsin
MVGRFVAAGLAILVVSCMALGAMGLVADASTGHGSADAAPHGTFRNTNSGAPVLRTASSAKAIGLGRALAVESGLRAKGISPSRVHFPNFAGAVADPKQPVVPSYTQGPAPMGVADLGLENRSGNLVPYALNSTSVAGTVNITDLQALYVDGDGPDSYGIQLNSVVNGVTIFGNSTYEFWSQNYVTYSIGTQQLVFGDEVWNFSSPAGAFPTSSLFAFGPNGTSSELPFLYQGYGPTFTIAYPFTLTLYLNTSTIGDRPALYFNYTVSNSSFRQSASYDYLIFNSSAGTPTAAAPVPYYQADGYEYDPIGLPNDMEIDLLGNDDGDTTAFLDANATVSLQYWNATTSGMEEVPSAYSAGQETGETSVGLLVYSSGGPSPIGIVRTGPSFVGGLWNYSGASTAVAYTLHLHPANAFLFVNPGGQENLSSSQWVPTSPSGTTVFYLPGGGTFYLDYLMSDFDPAAQVEVATTPATLTVHLFANSGEGVYTPLFAFDNAELAAISSSGVGSQARPYVLEANQYGTLAPQFAQWDDFLFPVFPGLLLSQTSAWVLASPPSFEIDLPSWQLASPYVAALDLPLTNDLQIQFYDASNISLVHATGISGWLYASMTSFPESSVMLWNCENVLIASNTFVDEGNALMLYGGSNNTIWDNTFVPGSLGLASPYSIDDSGGWLTGINESESGDLIFDNAFEVPVPAITPTVDPFECDQFGYCYPVTYSELWNVSEQPASDVQVVDGMALTGSIIGTSYQGGNYWSNYGTTSDPYGVLPYNDSAWITAGGDFVPLVPFSLYPVNYEETGLPANTTWTVTANGVSVSSTNTTIGIQSPNGSFPLAVGGPVGFAIFAPTNFYVAGTEVNISIEFAPIVDLQVVEQGLTTGIEWSATINGTGTGGTPLTESNDTGSITFEVVPGAYDVSAQAPGYSTQPTQESVTLGAGGATVPFNFTVPPGNLHLVVAPASASIWVNGRAVSPEGGSWSGSVAAGLATVEATESGYYPYFNNVSVSSGGTASLAIALDPITPPVGPNGTLSLLVSPGAASVWVNGSPVTLVDGAYHGSIAPGLRSVEATEAGYYAYFNNVTVKASATTSLTIQLTAIPSGSGPAPGHGVTNATGIDSTGWTIIGGLSALVVVLLIVAIYFSRRSARSAPPASSSVPPPGVK